MKTNSLRKKMVLEFIRIDEADTFTFQIHAKTEKDADTFIHGMRVELSRLREKVRNRGRNTKHFKMIKKSVKFIPNLDVWEIELTKTISGNDVTNEVDEIFEHLAGGGIINANNK